jgi:predicted PurR-regulated permease PerM
MPVCEYCRKPISKSVIEDFKSFFWRRYMVKEADIIYSKSAFIILFSLIIILSYKIVNSFLMAVVVGGLIAHALQPIQKSSLFKKIKPTHTAYLVISGLIVIVILPLGFFITSLIRQAVQFENYLAFHDTLSFQSLIESASKWPIINHFIDNSAQLQSHVKIWTKEVGTIISSFAIKQAAEIPSLFLQTILTLISCLVFLTEGEKLILWLFDKIPMKIDIKNSLLKSFGHSSKIAVWATLAAAVAQATTIFISFLVLGVPAATLATGATFIFSFIPILGATPVWILGAVYLYSKGLFLKFSFMILFGLVTGIVDNIARVYILKGPRGLHPLVGLIAVFGGIQVFGIFGVLIGPITIALLISMCEVWPQIWEK